jgi:hypothetical protein
VRYLAAATVFACILGALNLVLIMGVIRRLRTLTAAPPGHAPSVTLRPGESPAPFTATTIDDDIVTRDSIAGNLVGFFSPGCPACTDRLPEFVAYAEAVGGRRRALAVLIGEPEELADLAEQLNGVARLVIEPTFGEVATAFSTVGYPALCLIGEDSRVLHSGTDFVTFPPAGKLAKALV